MVWTLRSANFHLIPPRNGRKAAGDISRTLNPAGGFIRLLDRAVKFHLPYFHSSSHKYFKHEEYVFWCDRGFSQKYDSLTLFSFLSEASAGVFQFCVFFFHSSWMKLSFLSVQSHKPVTSWSRDLQHLRPTSPELRPKWRSSRWEHRLNRFSAMTTWGHQRVVSPCWRLWFLSVVSQPDRPPLHLWRIEDLF